jgi:tetratricopeptide (TPR) repeat protein
MRIRATVLLLLSLAVTPVKAQERSPQDGRFEAALGVARVKRDTGDFAAARRSFEEARTLRAFNAAQLAEYFWVVAAAKDHAAAFAAGREALNADPANHKVRDRVLTEAQALGKEAEVVAIAVQGRTLQITTALWPRRIGESYLRQGQPGLAADAFLQAASMADATDKDRESLAVSLEAAGRYRESVDAWRAITAPASSLSIDVAHSRLRAFALSNDAKAIAELDAWLVQNPGDTEVRALTIDVLTRLKQPAKALATAAPLTSDDWLRRKAGLARAADQNGAAIEFLNTLGRRMTSGDRLLLIDLLILERRFDGATAALASLAAGPLKCDDRVLGLADRIPGPAGTRTLIQALGQPPCQKTKWLTRAIERSVAASEHSTALRLIDRLPGSAAGSNDMLRLKGQLQLWTGDAPQAIPTLEAVVGQFPADAEARESLVDAYRAQQRPDEAWRVAAPLVASASLNQDQRLSLASLALEVDHPAAAVSLVGSPASDAGRELLGRALLMNGRAADAKTILISLAAGHMTSPAALALVDAIAVIDGAEAARSTAAQFDGRTAEWGDFLARRVVLEHLAGRKEMAASVRAVLAGFNPHLAAIADVESELAEGRPRRALELIAVLPNDPQPERVSDLEAIARAESGDTAGALAIVETLSRLRPESALLKMRVAELRYRIARGPESLSAILAIADANPGNAALAVRAGRALASAGQQREALALMYRTGEPANLPIEGRTLLAELRQIIDAPPPPTESRSVPTEPDSLTRARTFAAAERWTESLEAVDAALTVDPNAPAALKLRAEVLSWSGRHADAAEAYDAYLTHAPLDVEAKRQQARVLGWGGFFKQARQHYAALVREHPDNTRIAAEAAAKSAFYDGRWGAAADAYQRWLALEPEDGEARFEHAECLRAAGHASAAQAELRLLSAAGRHGLASAALDRDRVSRSAAVGAIGEAHSTAGYDNQRLLDVMQTGAAIQTSLGRAESALRMAVTRVAMSADDRDLRGNRVGLEAKFLVSPRLRIAGTGAAWDLGISGGPAVDASVTSVWRAADRWHLTAGFERTSVFENLETVLGQLRGTGPFAAIAFETPNTTFALRASAQELSDDNGRQRATLTWTRALPSRLKHVRLIGWAESLRYRTSSSQYFSPSRQIRADGGLQYTHEFSTPRFRTDRQQTFSFGYLAGLDDRGEIYHHPMMNLAVEFARGFSIDARASWIRSDVYRETSVFVGMTLTSRARIQ